MNYFLPINWQNTSSLILSFFSNEVIMKRFFPYCSHVLSGTKKGSLIGCLTARRTVWLQARKQAQFTLKSQPSCPVVVKFAETQFSLVKQHSEPFFWECLAKCKNHIINPSPLANAAGCGCMVVGSCFKRKMEGLCFSSIYVCLSRGRRRRKNRSPR